jgi:glycine hydroxymethyltransferase
MIRLMNADAVVATYLELELLRQQNQIELIASENIVSEAVLIAQGSVLTNKYAEGYPGRRYYGGCEHVDEVETLAIERAKQLFGCRYANVQPQSGAQANMAAFLATLEPGDTFLSMSLSHGGHLTHGAPVAISGKWFAPIHYNVRREDQRIDMDEVRALARKHRPKVIVAGGSAYSRFIDFKAFRSVADEIDALLIVDMAHYAGLVAAGVYPSPLQFAHITTTTTHKTLRGPRGGLILANDETLIKRLNSAVFPGVQGGPLMHIIAAKAVAFGEALGLSFKGYCKQVVKNARVLADVLTASGHEVVSGGTDCHLLLVDLRSKKLTGKHAEQALGNAGLTCNKNSIPFDPEKPTVTSGIRLGTPAATTRGFGENEFRRVGEMISEVLDGLARNGPDNNASVERLMHSEVMSMCNRFPIYSGKQHEASI